MLVMTEAVVIRLRVVTMVLILPVVFILLLGACRGEGKVKIPPASQAKVVAGPGVTHPTGAGPQSDTLIASREVHITLGAGTIARYLVREQLARLSVPSDAVGTTDRIEGSIRVGRDGAVLEDVSWIKVDLRSLRSDETRRDQYLRRNTLESDRFPFAEFVVLDVPGLQIPLPVAGRVTFQLMGDMTIHGVTAPLIWDVELFVADGKATGQATTSFPFHVFDMKIPNLFFILSVEDNIRLELDLALDVTASY
jgi:polyisoprenoid-binding protein YceI